MELYASAAQSSFAGHALTMLDRGKHSISCGPGNEAREAVAVGTVDAVMSDDMRSPVTCQSSDHKVHGLRCVSVVMPMAILRGVRSDSDLLDH